MADDTQNAIPNLLILYSLAVDSRSWDLFDQIFTEDIEADYGETSQWRARAPLKADFAINHAHLDATQHSVGNVLVRQRGDQAHAFSYCSWRYFRQDAPGSKFLGGLSWYDDSLVRQADGWRIQRRRCRLIWWDGDPAVAQRDPGSAAWLPRITSLAEETKAGRIAYLIKHQSASGAG